MVSLQACLTGLNPFRRARRRGSHNFFPTALVQDVHVLSDVVKTLLHLIQHHCRRERVRAQRTPESRRLLRAD